MTDDDDVLKQARGLPIAQRVKHAHWKARTEAFDEMKATCQRHSDYADADVLRAFGALATAFVDVCDDVEDTDVMTGAISARASERWRDLRFKRLTADALARAGECAASACADGNAAALDAGTEAVVALLTIADTSYADREGEAILAGVTTKGFGGRPRAQAAATECCMLLIELEQGEAVIDALLRATGHKVPKIALAATNAILGAVRDFGTPKVVPAASILKGLAPLFDAKDAKVRTAAKDITVEMTKWLGAQAVKRDLIDKMRAGMQADVNKAIANIQSGAQARRFLRKDQPAADDAPVAAEALSRDSSVQDVSTSEASVPVAAPDAYEYSEPESILPLLEKPGEGENPKFWDGIVSKKWQERLHALQTLTKVASVPRLAVADYGDVSKALKQVITKDSNVACVAEAARAAAALARGARKEWTRDARMLLPDMLDKLKDKTATVIEVLQGALSEFRKYCFELVDVVDDVSVALTHKVPKVQIETLKWLARSFEDMKCAEVNPLHKSFGPMIVKCTSASNGDARNSAMEAIASLAKVSGGIKPINFLLMDLDAVKRSKIEELASSNSSAPVSVPAPQLTVQRSNTTKVSGPQAERQPIAKAIQPVVGNEPLIARTATNIAESVSSISKDDAEARVVAMLTADVVTGLKSADWKERLVAMNSVLHKVRALDDAASDSFDALAIGLASFPGWSESNFQVMDKMFETLEILSTKSCFEFRHAAAAFDVLGEKLGCFKLGSRAASTLMSFSEALGPKIIMSRLRERAGNHKAPKVVVGALNWAGATGMEFGSECLDVEMMLQWAREAMETPNPMIKGAGAKLVGALHAVVGPTVKDGLGGLKDAQMRSLEVEFARNPYECDITPKRKVRAAKVSSPTATRTEPTPMVAPIESAPALVNEEPRTDISNRVNDDFINNMNDSNWKTRAAALEDIEIILNSVNNRISPSVGDLFKNLSARFADSNRNVGATALNVAGQVALAMGGPVEKIGRNALSEVVKYFGDSKKNVREAALKACTCWVTAAGLSKVLPTIAEKFQEYSAKITAEGKKEVVEWCSTMYSQHEGVEDTVCASAVHIAAVGLMDKATESRKAGTALMDAILAKVDAEAVRSASKSLKGDVSSAIDAYFNRGHSKTLAFRAAGAAVVAANALKTTAAERNAARKAVTLGGGSRTSEAPMSVPNGPVFLKDAEKAMRIRKYPRKAMKFEPLRDDDMALVTNELKTASQAYIRADVHKLMFTNDMKGHLAALDALEEAIKSDEAELINSLDLLIRWLVLRISESSPNTQVLTRVLEVVLAALHAACDLDYKLVEQEAAILLPVFVEKSGHNIETIRDKFRKISRAIPTVYLASKFVGYLTTGMVETKSSRTRAECLDEVSRLIERYGMLVCLREDKTLEHVAKFVETRDMSLRNCALNCLACAYKVAGDLVWKRIGQLPSEQVREVVSDKFARVAKEMTLNNEGAPGDWVNFNPIPITSALEGASVSKSVDVSTLASSRLANMLASSATIEGTNSSKDRGINMLSQSISVLPSQRPISARSLDVEMSDVPMRAPAPELTEERVLIGARTPNKTTLTRTKTSVTEVSASAWSRALTGVNDLDEQVAVEAMKAVCHEIVKVKDDVAAHAEMAHDIEAIVQSMVKRIEHIFITAIATPTKGTRACRYVLNALMHVYQDRAFATAISEPTQREFIEQLIRVILDERVAKLEDGESLMKAANILLIAMMENCTRSFSFVAFVTLLHNRPANVPTQFDSMLVKCLIKLTRSLQLSVDNVHIPTIIGAIHGYFEAFGMDEINARAKLDDQGLRAIKTLLHEITARVGDNVYDYCSSIPSRTSIPTPIIYSFIGVNLMAPNSTASPSVQPIKLASQPTPGSSVKRQLVAIFKKIGEKGTTSQGLEDLYTFTRDHPEEDLTPHLERTSEAFQMYIKRGLQKVEAVHLRKSPSVSVTAPINPSPVAEAKSSAAVYRERLAQLQDNIGVEIAPAKPSETDDALSDLERLRRRMNSINAKATGQELPS